MKNQLIVVQPVIGPVTQARRRHFETRVLTYLHPINMHSLYVFYVHTIYKNTLTLNLCSRMYICVFDEYFFILCPPPPLPEIV